MPMDILSVKTGLSVSDGYTYSLSWNIILGTIVFLMVYLFNRRIQNIKPERIKSKGGAAVQRSRVSGGGAAVLFLYGFFHQYRVQAGFLESVQGIP